MVTPKDFDGLKCLPLVQINGESGQDLCMSHTSDMENCALFTQMFRPLRISWRAQVYLGHPRLWQSQIINLFPVVCPVTVNQL